MPNGDSDIIKTIPSAAGCQAHGAIVQTLAHGEKRFDEMNYKLDQIKTVVIDRGPRKQTMKVPLPWGKTLEGEPADIIRLVLVAGVVWIAVNVWIDKDKRDKKMDELRQEIHKVRGWEVGQR